jgi:hypothetical protein
MNTIYLAASWLVVPAWLLLLFAPRSNATKWFAQYTVPMTLAVVYVILLLLPHKGGGGFESLQQLSLFFRNDEILLAGWIHYLVLDLLIGNWESSDAARLGMSRALVAPCLTLTFFFAPAGWLSYILLRATRYRR